MKNQMVGHDLIHEEECNSRNSSHLYDEGYDWYSCVCGEWRGCFKNEMAAAMVHRTHAMTSIRMHNLRNKGSYV